MLSAIAEDPAKIQSMIETKEINKAGVYLLNFYINGIKTPVIVDDYLPVFFETG